MRRLILLLALALLAVPAAAEAAPSQTVSFEAPRELLSFQDRDRTLDEIRDFGVTRIRQLVYWKSFAPRPNSKRKPKNFDAANPDSYPAGTWTQLDELVAGAARRGHHAAPQPHRARSRSGRPRPRRTS